MVLKYINSKRNIQKYAAPLCLGSVSKDFSTDSMKKTRLCGYDYDFSVDYNNMDVVDILDIHKYLNIFKNNTK